MQFLKLKTLSWNPSWYQKYSYTSQDVWKKETSFTAGSDPRKILKTGKRKREARWGSVFPWWLVKEIR